MKFKFLQKVKHVKTGDIYRIVGTPDQIRIEADNSPAYAYQFIQLYKGNKPNLIWVRCQSEMEDGRFV